MKRNAGVSIFSGKHTSTVRDSKSSESSEAHDANYDDDVRWEAWYIDYDDLDYRVMVQDHHHSTDKSDFE